MVKKKIILLAVRRAKTLKHGTAKEAAERAAYLKRMGWSSNEVARNRAEYLKRLSYPEYRKAMSKWKNNPNQLSDMKRAIAKMERKKIEAFRIYSQKHAKKVAERRALEKKYGRYGVASQLQIGMGRAKVQVGATMDNKVKFTLKEWDRREKALKKIMESIK